MGETVDHRADIWSFGVVLHEMVTGTRPAPEVRLPSVLFRADLVPNPRTDEYAVTADGQRFLLKSIPKGDRPALTVLINWARGG